MARVYIKTEGVKGGRYSDCGKFHHVHNYRYLGGV